MRRRVLLDDIIDLFMGTIIVTHNGDEIFNGSKDDFWTDPTVDAFFRLWDLGINNTYVDSIEAAPQQAAGLQKHHLK